MKREHGVVVAVGVAAVILAGILFVGLPRWYGETPDAGGAGGTGGTEEGEFVEATLFYISDDGMQLVGFERRLKREPGVAEQARRIVEAQLAEPPPPLLSPIPRGTRLNGFYMTDRGEAFVDLSEQVALAHSGGSLEELFTVYAIVNALTANVPSVTAVQILVDGSEVDTLVGHVDLRNPLAANMQLVADPDAEDASAAARPDDPGARDPAPTRTSSQL